MSREKTIAAIGLSENEIAHLRRLVHACADQLEVPWRWGDEDAPDLIVVDTGSLAGQMARARAQGSGIRFAVFSDQPVHDGDLLLRRPLLRANVIDVLNTAARAVVHCEKIGAHTADFYTRDIGEEATPARSIDDEAPVAGLDDVLRHEPAELRKTDGEPPAPPAATVLGRKYATRESMLEDTAPRELREYLEGDLVRMPARYVLPGAPALTLDPKNKVAHAVVGLGALEPYCRARWRLCDWQPLTSAELAEAREEQQSHSYARLVWLHVLLHSGGELARHLDPGGTYRLKHSLEVEKEFGKYARIGPAMLQPTRLHEIASAAGAPMADVFDLVNAYDAIGLIEWQPRARRHDDKPAKSGSLFGKLRNPFSKS
ncbi:hypothetical protein [Dokdonella soli]|uniref:Uncharacterized protein n=1 Tax=Dokdonella soli TaxID=529810 RepID=A0ABN1IY39_9GAMM